MLRSAALASRVVASTASVLPRSRWASTRRSCTHVNAAWCASMSISFLTRRRRHTRLVSDWSSDVCSSDLGSGRVQPGPARGSLGRADGHGDLLHLPHPPHAPVRAVLAAHLAARPPGLLGGPDPDLSDRSEERRVGKASMCWWRESHCCDSA